jgi:tripartite-type tricarboxylate transporter receptor subunit TctC
VDFENETGTKFQVVPYRGAAPAMQDLLAGTIDLFCPEAGQTLPQFRAGSIKAYAVLTEKRWFAAPDVPTIDEAGVPGLHFPFWHGMWAPKGVPADVLARLNAAVVAALADPTLRKRFNDLGHEVVARDQQTQAALAVPQGRDRQVVADHQGGEHQAAVRCLRRSGRPRLNAPWRRSSASGRRPAR